LINTKKVAGRREVHYESLDEVLAEAETFASENVKQLGNWSPGQIYEHLARSMNSSSDGFSSIMPAPVRWMLTLLMKKKFLTKTIPAGFKSPAEYTAEDSISAEDGLAALRHAIQRQKDESKRAPHPGFGKITNDEWNQFNLRHAEMHMSFLVPE
jgi:hypothetical protein